MALGWIDHGSIVVLLRFYLMLALSILTLSRCTASDTNI